MKEIEINNFEEKLFFEKLDNGLLVYLLPFENKKNFYAVFGTKYGSDDIEFKINGKRIKTPTGIAHFLEHKMFDISSPTPFEYYSKTGTDINAYTTSDHTAYHFFGNNDFLNNLKYLLKWITTFNTTEEKIEKEQGIILEESRMYKDSPERILYEKLKENTIVNDYRRIKTIGTDSDIVSIDKNFLDLCYKSFYRPDNMFLVVVGSFNKDETIKTIKNELKNFKNSKDKISKIHLKELDTTKKEYEELDMNVSVPNIGISVKINKNKFKGLKLEQYKLDYYLQMILSLNFSFSSNFREDMENKGLFNSLSYQISDIKEHYLIDFYSTSNKKEEYIITMKNYLNKMTVSKDAFERTKKTWIASEIRISDNISVMASNIIEDILDYGEYKNTKIKDIRSLNFKELKEILKLFTSNNKTILVINPKK